MVQSRRTNIKVPVRVRQISGQIAIVVGLGLLIYGLGSAGILPAVVVIKPNFSCPGVATQTAPSLDQEVRDQSRLQLDSASRELWRDQVREKKQPGTATTAAVRLELAARKKALVETMRTNPEAAVGSLLSKSDRSRLSKFATNCLETPVTYQGKLAIKHLDDFHDESESLFQYDLTTADGTKLNLHIAHDDQINFPSNSQVGIRGFQVGNDVLLDMAAAPAGTDVDTGGLTIVSPAAAPPATHYKAAIILGYFSDETVPVTPTVAGVRDLLNTTINDYYQENSYGKVGFSGNVYGWYQAPITAANCNYGTMESSLLAAADPDIDFNQYTHVIFIFHGSQPNCPYGGLASLNQSALHTGEGNKLLYDSFVSSVSAYVMGHELGHNLGLNHAQYYPCDPPYTDYYYSYYDPACVPQEYGDIYDILGTGFPGHFSAPHKERVGFFDPGMIQTVPSGTHDYVLEPIETASQGLKALKVLRGVKTVSGADDYLYVEYRQPIGFDASFAPYYSADVYNGAVLHVFGASNTYSGLFDPTPAMRSNGTSTLPVGSSYTDPMSGIMVTTTGQTSDALAVTVTSGRDDLAPPFVGFLDPNYNQEVSGTIPVTVTAGDSSGINRVDFYIGSKAGPKFASVTSGPYTTSLDTTTLPNGSNTIVAVAYDQAGQAAGLEGNFTTTSRNIIVANNDIVPPTVSLTSPNNGNSFPFGRITFSADASDNVGIWKVEFYVDGSSLPTTIDVSSPFSGSTKDFTIGSHTIKAAAYDFAGNRVDTPPVSFSVVSDTENPTASMLTPIDGQVVSGFVHVTFMKNDNSGYFNSSFLMVDNSPVLTAIPAADEYWWDSRSVADGLHTLAYEVGDAQGLYGEAAPVTVTVDNSTPVVSIDSPGSGSLAATVMINVTATHPRGIQRVDFYRDGVRLVGSDTIAPYQLTWDTQTIVTGAHTITARAVSTTGSVATSPPVSVTTSDLTPPTITLDFPANGATINGPVTLTATATDIPSPSTPAIDFYVDGTLIGTATTAPYSFAWNGYLVSPGTHTVAAVASDGTGNASSTTPITITTLPADGGPPAAVMDLTAH